MIENYPDLNREETLDAVSGFSGQKLASFIEFEREHKDRVSVIEPLERQLIDVRPTGGRKYVAGVWFDDPTESRTVRRSRRIEQAIDAGEIEVVDG